MAETAEKDTAGRQGGKSQAAFRTIAEVAAELKLPQHVLRFWESKFTQIRPLKRGGGRRYYRPEDVEVLRRIRSLLYQEGYTIRGAQKLLRQRAPEKAYAGEVASPDKQGVDGLLDPEVRNELRELVAELEEIRRRFLKCDRKT
ncbi:MAG TPA: MerR family transcriptional regulator [Candidatus Limnocylindria bacterium]|nr:MerR family transcriptional regulator [Candidatus Limnocylindria bacterium]